MFITWAFGSGMRNVLYQLMRYTNVAQFCGHYSFFLFFVFYLSIGDEIRSATNFAYSILLLGLGVDVRCIFICTKEKNHLNWNKKKYRHNGRTLIHSKFRPSRCCRHRTIHLRWALKKFYNINPAFVSLFCVPKFFPVTESSQCKRISSDFSFIAVITPSHSK